MKNKKQIKASCSACVHKKVCHYLITFPGLGERFVEDSGKCPNFSPTAYDLIMNELKGCGFEDD